MANEKGGYIGYIKAGIAAVRHICDRAGGDSRSHSHLPVSLGGDVDSTVMSSKAVSGPSGVTAPERVTWEICASAVSEGSCDVKTMPR